MYEIIDNEIHKRLEKMKLLITNQGVTLFAFYSPSYPKDAFQMLPMVLNVTRYDSIDSQSLWADTRNMRETHEFLEEYLKKR
jgi:hypothetical protein